MKKPNITEGEWIYDLTHIPNVYANNPNYCWIAEANKNIDAKAISAVPDMIDALMVALEDRRMHLAEWGITGSEKIQDKEYAMYFNALKKAGCK